MIYNTKENKETYIVETTVNFNEGFVKLLQDRNLNDCRLDGLELYASLLVAKGSKKSATIGDNEFQYSDSAKTIKAQLLYKDNRGAYVPINDWFCNVKRGNSASLKSDNSWVVQLTEYISCTDIEEEVTATI
jgi:hypothetical protein